MFQTGKMIYRNLGNTGLKVSVVSFGNFPNCRPENRDIDHQIIVTCLKNGINFFDTAELYAQGQAEIALGQSLKKIGQPRQNVVIATKIWTGKDPTINSERTLSRKHIKQAIDQCLKRLQMEYVDVVYAHNFDRQSPMQEICESFHEIIEDGKAFYWATGNWSAQQIFQALTICQKYNLHKPICGQIQYNMLVRKEVQINFRKLIQKYSYGICGWSALAGGFLTGKYLDGIKQEKTRLTDQTVFSTDVLKRIYYQPHNNQKTIASLKQLQKIAQQMGYKLHHLALAWIIRFKCISSAIIGARNADQIEDTLKGLELVEKITPQFEEKINAILDNNSDKITNFLTMKPIEQLRTIKNQ